MKKVKASYYLMDVGAISIAAIIIILGVVAGVNKWIGILLFVLHTFYCVSITVWLQKIDNNKNARQKPLP